VKLTDDILHVLGSAHPDGNLLRLDGQLPAALYQRVDAVLQTAGGRWDKRQQAHVFPGGAWQAVLDLTSYEEVTTAREAQQAAGWFPTPPEVVERLLELAAPQPSMRALEPSAGEGAIAVPLAALAGQVDAFELDPGRAATLTHTAPHIHTTRGDFLTAPPPAAGYDLIVMNPPFSRGGDVRHVTHALRFLGRGGRKMVSSAAALSAAPADALELGT
jgi:hypothetical protein